MVNTLTYLIGVMVIGVVVNCNLLDCPQRDDPPAPLKQLVRSSQYQIAYRLQVAMDLNREKKNYVFSPVAISMSLALLEPGAAGKTQRELEDFLVSSYGTKPSFESVAELYQTLQQTLNKFVLPAKFVRLALALSKDMKVLDNYADAITCYYPEHVKIDLKDAKAVNAFMKRVMPEDYAAGPPPVGAMDGCTKILVAAPFHMQARWAQKFFPVDGQQPFKSLGGKQMVNYMRTMGKFRYRNSTTGYQQVSIPYEGGELELVLELPPPNEPERVQCELDLDERYHITQFDDSRTVEVRMPKFSFRNKINVNELLQDADMGNPFTLWANFKRLFNYTEPLRVYRPMCNMLHHATFSVNETGTSAQGTSFAAAPEFFSDEAPLVFNVDRPFIFKVRNVQMEVTLLTGRVYHVENYGQ